VFCASGQDWDFEGEGCDDVRTDGWAALQTCLSRVVLDAARLDRRAFVPCSVWLYAGLAWVVSL